MILYNVTVNVEETVEQEWLQWMQSEHILDVLNTGMFKHAKIFRLLHIEQTEGTATYAVQFFAESMQHFDTYQEKYAPTLRAEHEKRFGGRTVSFRTLMEEV